MTPPNTNGAHQRRLDPRPDDGHLYLLRDSTRDHDGHSGRERRLNIAVRSIQILSPLSQTSSNPTGLPMDDDGLSAARGMFVGVALGAGFWLAIAGLIRSILS